MKVYFATSNPWKYKEIKAKFDEAGLELGRINAKLIEIQDATPEEVALMSVRHAYEEFKKPLFVEDAGVHIKALKGFPGIFSSFVYHTIGLGGVLKLMKGMKDRKADFISVIAYKDAKHEKVFKGICRGSITKSLRGTGGFGYSPIFLPEGKTQTFGEKYDYKSKQFDSHRMRSTKKLIKWLNGRKS